MNSFIENITGTTPMTDQVIASDLLISAKSGIKNYAAALTESTSPEVRNVLCDQLNKAVNLHEQIFNYMKNNGYYNAYDPDQQIQMDIQNADKALSLPKM
ncbi:spore coat protein [Paenibacillus polymyxa]|uniref:Spore coat protein F-like protein yraD n=1 Tax=Paenibacillus polymyxa TaxID=1406 RepID=A0A378XPH1_PAEPO|nr:spore coat protein [Paenibacillus polymyxa]MBE7900473.1 spore coat protein [Paenibacillus polymyxa]MBG9766111.1 spore gernimation protein GerQ [Paenibacillus polymyxa]MBY7737250.1 spore coat protein [Paenibacillus polymyxa]MCC3260672.1 spore coat protein [Paenibacillus polymyxa]MEE4580884.1 spore coat protein [Paenibacillus polymyxa]